MPTHRGDELKILIVQQVIGGKSIYSLADQFGISKDTIRRWVIRTEQIQQKDSEL